LSLDDKKWLARVQLLAAMELDAVVLCDALSRHAIAGLSARERAVRVARRAGATRVRVVDDSATGSRDGLVAWRGARAASMLVIRADQLVHPPLVLPLIAAAPGDALAIAVEPGGGYAGALLATGSRAAAVVEALGDRAERVEHGEVGRAPIGNPDEVRAAHRLLYKILIKPQDNAITRYLYRPVSFPLTRLLARTPITPNQISYLVAAFVALGCWITAHASHLAAFVGTTTVLAASYLDCCDGEIARLKLLSSKMGAWLDTIVDELSSVGYMAALGWHCHLAFGRNYFGDFGFDPWVVAIAIGVVTYGFTIYCVYYNIIVAVGSANSQDYVGRFEVVPGKSESSRRLAPASTKAIAPTKPLPPWLAFIATYMPYIVRRDFISWGATVLAALSLTQVSFAIQALGGVVTCVIVGIDHVKLRALRRSVVRGGHVLESPSR